mmetsp:Transcript_39520/g.124322  ORF Transcript_39520/g.124322 Transcript_39520/m.124322 type:complete len:229 (-) Transcript_39520:230-916(-)
MGVFGKCLRVTGESLSTFLFLTSVALLTFGIFLYIKWESDETTSSHPIPGYIYLIMSVGGSASLGNLVGYMGACSRSSLVLSCSVWFLFVVVLCELSLSLVLLLNPSLIDTVVCPEGDEACINKLDNMFKDPSSHAGIVVACVCGCQLFALIILGLLQRDIRSSLLPSSLPPSRSSSLFFFLYVLLSPPFPCSALSSLYIAAQPHAVCPSEEATRSRTQTLWHGSEEA